MSPITPKKLSVYLQDNLYMYDQKTISHETNCFTFFVNRAAIK